ncbi:hypothetical protein N9N03_02480 [Chlamydiia bacterium]|nr:hypothetical protein [Chlamydiia bacterium]
MIPAAQPASAQQFTIFTKNIHVLKQTIENIIAPVINNCLIFLSAYSPYDLLSYTWVYDTNHKVWITLGGDLSPVQHLSNQSNNIKEKMLIITAKLIKDGWSEEALDLFGYFKNYVKLDVLSNNNYKIYKFNTDNGHYAIIDDQFNKCQITGIQYSSDVHLDKIYDGTCFYHDKNKNPRHYVEWVEGRIVSAIYETKTKKDISALVSNTLYTHKILSHKPKNFLQICVNFLTEGTDFDKTLNKLKETLNECVVVEKGQNSFIVYRDNSDETSNERYAIQHFINKKHSNMLYKTATNIVMNDEKITISGLKWLDNPINRFVLSDHCSLSTRYTQLFNSKYYAAFTKAISSTPSSSRICDDLPS